MSTRRVLVIGLDCAAPQLVFEAYRDDVPVLSRLAAAGTVARMRSCHPPITIPAWAVMTTSRSPGALGIYGFRHRRGPSYTEGWIANSRAVTAPAIWDYLGRRGRPSIIVGVPPGYPVPEITGHAVSCFITPPGRPYTHPASLGQEIDALVGRYLFDVEFRTDDRGRIRDQLYEMTEKRLRVVRHLLTTKPWDYFHWVEIGTDRAHHAFWKFMDPTHHKYVPGNPYESVIRDYYRYLDGEIGKILSLLDDDTIVLVVSDHGAKRMKGAFCVNEWLIQEGYLALRTRPEKIGPVEQADVDWSRTTAWGWGGYYARIFFNIQGREPEGIVPRARVPALRDELTARLLQVRDPAGRVMDTKVYPPEALYPVVRGDAPDLMVYFDDLYWRSAGTVGYPPGTLYLDENDTGPDDAVHDYDGIFILHDPRDARPRDVGTVDILDIAPTVLSLMGEAVPPEMEGRPLPERMAAG